MHLTVAGHPLHTRSLTLTATLADTGLWNVRGDVIDLRKCGFVPLASDIQPAGIIHNMSIELTLDPRTRRIESLATEQPFVAMEASEVTQGECCRDPAPRLAEMVGEALDEQFAKRLSLVFGGPRGCSHLLTLFQLMASGLSHAFPIEESIALGSPHTRDAGERLYRRSCMVEGFERLDGDIEMTVQLADFHTRPGPALHPLHRLLLQHDVRGAARVAIAGFGLHDVVAAERRRGAMDLAEAEWSDRTNSLADLETGPIVPGVAGKLFRLFGSAPEDAPLRDAFLQLAPGYIQVLAALTDRWFSEDGTTDGTSGLGSQLAIGAVGGQPNSCFMWRDGGAMAVSRARDEGAEGGST